jgi:hypothetical protein
MTGVYEVEDLYFVHITFDIYWVDTSAGGLLIPESIIRPVDSVSALKWFIRYIYFWNLQFLNHVIIFKTKVLLLDAYMTLADFVCLVYDIWLNCS